MQASIRVPGSAALGCLRLDQVFCHFKFRGDRGDINFQEKTKVTVFKCYFSVFRFYCLILH